MALAASRREPVGSETARGLLLALVSQQHPSQQDHGPSTSPGQPHARRLTPRPSPGTAKSRLDRSCAAFDPSAVRMRLLRTKTEAAEQLGVSVRTIERLISAGRLPLVHVEGAARVRVADLQGYVQSLDTDHRSTDDKTRRRLREKTRRHLGRTSDRATGLHNHALEAETFTPQPVCLARPA